MAAKDRPAKTGQAAWMAQGDRYLQRLLEDEELRSSLLAAYDSARSAYGRMSNGRGPTHALFEDPKLQKELVTLAMALRERLGVADGAAGQAQAPPRARTATLAAAAHRRRRARAGPQRGPALEGSRHAVRRRGGVRLHLDHRSADTRTRGRGRRLSRGTTAGGHGGYRSHRGRCDRERERAAA